MNPQTEENLHDYDLQKLVTEVDPDSVELTPLADSPNFNSSSTGIAYYVISIVIRSFRNAGVWFWSLPGFTKLVVILVGFVLGFAILQAALKLIAAAISMTLLAGLVYLGYNFFVAGSSSQIKE